MTHVRRIKVDQKKYYIQPENIIELLLDGDITGSYPMEELYAYLSQHPGNICIGDAEESLLVPKVYTFQMVKKTVCNRDGDPFRALLELPRY